MKWGVAVVVALFAVAACARLVDIREVDKVVFGKGANKMVQRNTAFDVDNIVCTAVNYTREPDSLNLSWKCDAINSTNVVSHVYDLSCYNIMNMFATFVDVDKCTLEFDMSHSVTEFKRVICIPLYTEVQNILEIVGDSIRTGSSYNVLTYAPLNLLSMIAVGCIYLGVFLILFGVITIINSEIQSQRVSNLSSSAPKNHVVSTPINTTTAPIPSPENRATCPTCDVSQQRTPKQQRHARREERNRARRLKEQRRMCASDM